MRGEELGSEAARAESRGRATLGEDFGVHSKRGVGGESRAAELYDLSLYEITSLRIVECSLKGLPIGQ